MRQKVCVTCREKKNLAEFYRHSCTKDGYMWACGLCHDKRMEDKDG